MTWYYFFLLIFFNKNFIVSGKIPINEKDIKTWIERISEWFTDASYSHSNQPSPSLFNSWIVTQGSLFKHNSWIVFKSSPFIGQTSLAGWAKLAYFWVSMSANSHFHATWRYLSAFEARFMRRWSHICMFQALLLGPSHVE